MRIPLLFVAASLFLASCAGGLRVDSDFDSSASFAGYHTFSWISSDPMIRPVGNSASVSPLNQRRMQDAIEAEFAAKGYTLKQDPASADFIVSFTVGARDKIDVADYPAPYRWDNHWSWSSFERTFSVHQYREGQLAIDIFDGQSHRPVWHGAVSKRITESMRKDPKPQIDAAVKAILTRFPPGARAKP